MWSKPVQMCQTPSFRYVENCAHGPDVSPPTIALRRVGAEHDAAALPALDQVQQPAVLRVEAFEQPVVDRERRTRHRALP